MTKRDGIFLLFIVCVLALICSPALFSPSLTFGNFGDVYAYHWPLQHLTADALISGRLPFWNPYIFSGLPHFANSQSSMFYPPAALFRIFPLAYSFTLYSFFHLFLGALGMYLWMRVSKMSASASALFALAFALCPFVIYRIPQGIPTHLASLAFVPWAWLALRSGKFGFLSVVWALQLLSGHPQFGMVNAFGLAAYAGWSYFRGRKDIVVAFIREGAICCVLCLIQLVPMIEFLKASNRSGIPESFKAAYSVPVSAFGTLIWPGLYGDPVRGTFNSVPSVFFEMYSVYIGWLPLLLIAVGCWHFRRREKSVLTPDALFGAGLAVAGLILALGVHNPLSAFFAGVPIAGLSRVPARFALLGIWGGFLAASFGWRVLSRNKNMNTALKISALILVCADLGFWASRFIYAEDPAPYLRPNEAIRKSVAGAAMRLATGPDIANPNKTMLYRAMNVNGYDAFYLDSYTKYAAKSEKGPAGDPSRMYIQTIDTPEMKRLGVAAYLSSDKRAGPFMPVAGNTRLYLQSDTKPLAHSEATGRAVGEIHRLSPEHWVLSGDGGDSPDRLILSVPKFRGWTAYIDGKETLIEEFEGLIQSVPVPVDKGRRYRVDFLFRPSGWNYLCFFSLTAWLLWGAALRRIYLHE